MQGMRFLLVNQDNEPFNHGVISERITEDKYLCEFAALPSVSRVCGLKEIMGWNLFATDELMNEFIKSLQVKNALQMKKDETDVKVETTEQESAAPAASPERKSNNGGS